MKSTAKREVLTGVITFLVYGILGFAAYLLTALPEAGLDSLAASHAVFIIGSIASSAVLIGGIAFGIVFGRKRSNGYLIGLVASVVFFLGAGLGFIVSMISLFTYGSDGKMYSDDSALSYIKGAKAAGLKVGVYFFSQAVNNDEAIEEADYIKTLLGDETIDFPVAYDWEIIKDDDARTDSVSAAQATACAKAFCNRVKELGYTPIIYSPSKELYFKYDLTQLADFDIWYCEYANVPTFYYQFSMWQYSSSGKVDGIEGDVDMNICFTNIADYD